MQTQIILTQTLKETKESKTNYKELTMEYYLFKVKMGHVGKTKYLPMIIPIRATSLEEAVVKANNHGGVKRDHKDWCLEIPREVSYDEYKKQEKITYSDPYWEAKTRSNLSLFADRLVGESSQIEEEKSLKQKNKKRTHVRRMRSDYLNDYYDEIEEGYDHEYDYV